MADSKRQFKYAKLIQKDLGEIFLRLDRNFVNNAFVTISGVIMSPDLSMAKIYVSALMVEDKQKFIEALNERKREIRKLLGNKIGKQVRAIPALVFYLDESLDQVEKMDQVFKDLNIQNDADGKDTIE